MEVSTRADSPHNEGPLDSTGVAEANAPRWIRGAVVLGAAALISKVLGTLQKIPLQNVAGDRVFGLYNAVYPFYQLMLFLSTAGIPIAVSLLVTEYAERRDAEGARRVLTAASLLLGLTGIAGFALMWIGAGTAARWIGDAEAAPAIRASAAALWFVPLMAALRGYFQGLHYAVPSAVSQVTEQTVRVAAMLTLLGIGWSAGWGAGALAAGATAGSAAGGAAGLAVLAGMWLKLRRTELAAERLSTVPRAAHALWPLIRRLSALAVPVAIGSIAVPLAGIVDAFTVPKLLTGSGLTAAEAMTQFGLYSRGQPLVQLVVMVAGAMAGMLVPALTAARARGSLEAARLSAVMAVRLAWWVGAAASLGLVLLAEPLNIMLYADADATRTFALIGCTALAGTLNAVTAAVLLGFGRLYLPALYLLLATLLKAALNAALVPALGIAGAAWAGIAALAAAALLGAAAVRRTAGAPVPALRFAAGTGLALACTAAALVLTERGFAALLGPSSLPPRAAATLLALTGTAVGAAVFAAVLLRSGGIGAREMRALPGGDKLAARLRRWQLLPPEA